MVEERASTRLLTVEEAARRLDVQPASVRMFVRQRFLRLGTAEPMEVWEADVERLHRVLLRRTMAEDRPHAW
jgi:hypothetical protein